MAIASSTPTISKIFSYLVHPGKGVAKQDQKKIRGTTVPPTGKLHDVIADLFAKAEAECNLSIIFNPSDNGKQQNDCRDLVLRCKKKPTITSGRRLAIRLQEVTDKRSGLGLLFLIIGKQGANTQILISRFPADSGIIADEKSASLTVEFVEKIFLKNSRAYKTVLYSGQSDKADFWRGQAIDRQINDEVVGLPTYWINEFLASSLRTTSESGTLRLATAANAAIRASKDVATKTELVSACTLARGYSGKAISIRSLCRSLRLSENATEALKSQLKNSALFSDRFQLSLEVLDKNVAFRTEELDNGAMLTAENSKFEHVFQKDKIPHSDQLKYTTQGKLVDERIRRSK